MNPTMKGAYVSHTRIRLPDLIIMLAGKKKRLSRSGMECHDMLTSHSSDVIVLEMLYRNALVIGQNCGKKSLKPKNFAPKPKCHHMTSPMSLPRDSNIRGGIFPYQLAGQRQEEA